MTPEQRALRARLASHTSWALTTDRRARAKPGSDALMARIAAQVDPQGLMAPGDREKAIKNAVSAYFSRLSMRSAQKRRSAT